LTTLSRPTVSKQSTRSPMSPSAMPQPDKSLGEGKLSKPNEAGRHWARGGHKSKQNLANDYILHGNLSILVVLTAANSDRAPAFRQRCGYPKRAFDTVTKRYRKAKDSLNDSRDGNSISIIEDGPLTKQVF